MTAFINQKTPNIDFRPENEEKDEEMKIEKENNEPYADFLKKVEGMFDERVEEEMS